MANYAGSGTRTNAFLQGALGGASLVHGVARDNRLDDENQRRYNDEKARADRTEQRAIEAEAGKKAAAQVQYMLDQAGGDFDKALEMFPGPMTELINTNPVLAPLRERLAGGERVDKAAPLAGMVAMTGKDGKRRYALTVNAVNPETGERYKAPVSQNRGTNDPVVTFSSRELYGPLAATLAPYGYQDPNAAIDALAKIQPRSAPGGLAASVPQSAPGLPPGAPARGPAAPVPPPAAVPPPVGAAPAAAGPTPAAPAKPKDIQDLPTLGSRFAGGMDDLKNAGEPQRVADVTARYKTLLNPDSTTGALVRSMTPDPTGTIGKMMGANTHYRFNRETLAKSGNFSPDELGQLDRYFLGKELGSPEPDVKVEEAFGEDSKRLSPGIVARETQQERLTANLPAQIPAAVQSRAVTVLADTVPGRRPNREQLAAVLLLKRQGIVSSEQVSRYARTGNLDEPKLQSFNPEHDLYKDGQLVRRGAPSASSTAAAVGESIKQRVNAIKHYESSMKDLIEPLNGTGKKGPPKYTVADFNTRVAEGAIELEKMGVQFDPQVLAYSPHLKSVLATAYKEAVDGDKPAGWFAERVRKPIEDAMKQLYPTLAKPQATAQEVVVNGQTRRVAHDPETNKYYYVD